MGSVSCFRWKRARYRTSWAIRCDSFPSLSRMVQGWNQCCLLPYSHLSGRFLGCHLTTMQEAETVTSQHMTDDPLSLGTQHQLGTHRATYKPPTTASQIILWSIFLLLFLGIALWAMIETVGVYFYHIPWLIVLGGAIVFVIIALHVYRIRNVIQNRTQSVFVYDDGLNNVWHTSLQVIYWQRVQAVW